MREISAMKAHFALGAWQEVATMQGIRHVQTHEDHIVGLCLNDSIAVPPIRRMPDFAW